MAATITPPPSDHPTFFSAFGGLWPDRSDAEAELARRRASGAITDREAALFSQWIRNGYVVLENAVPRDVVDAYNRDIDRLLAQPDPRLKIEVGTRNEIAQMERSLITPENSVRIVDHYVYAESPRAMLGAEPVQRFLRQLFDGGALLFQSLGFEYGSQQGFHQDTAYVVTGEPMTIAGVWIAAEDVQAGSGELRYYRGSHRLPEYFFSGKFKSWKPDRDGPGAHAEWSKLLNDNAAGMGLEIEVFRPKRGTALIWHSDLAHGGAPITRPGATRRSLVGHFCPARVEPLYFRPPLNRSATVPYRDLRYSSLHYDLTPRPPAHAPEAPRSDTGLAGRLAKAVAKRVLPRSLWAGMKDVLYTGPERGNPVGTRLEKLGKAAKKNLKAATQKVAAVALEQVQEKLQQITSRLDRIDAEIERLKSSKDTPVWERLPPRDLMELVGGAATFRDAGAHLFNGLVQHAGLQPHESVLDIGCGCGSTALHLVKYLGTSGRYRGFDIVKASIDWCNEAISRDCPNFQFTHADIFNGLYNPKGVEQSARFRFPYDDDTFDVAYLGSVFTHMYRADIVHYVDEIKRVLKPGGRCLASFFLLDDTSRKLMTGPKSQFDFKHVVPSGGFTTDPNRPEGAIAFDQDDAVSIFDAAGMKVRKPLVYGLWSGREGVGQQDYIISVKPSAG